MQRLHRFRARRVLSTGIVLVGSFACPTLVAGQHQPVVPDAGREAVQATDPATSGERGAGNGEAGKQQPATREPPAATPSTTPAESSTPLGPLQGKIYRDLDNNLIDLRDVAGKPMVIELWATWCGPCRTQRTLMHKMAEEFPDIVFVAASTDEKGPSVVKEFKSKFRSDNPADSRVRDVMSTPQLRSIINAFRTERTIPQTIYVSRRGEIMDLALGTQSEAFMRAVLKNMAKPPKQQPTVPNAPPSAQPSSQPNQPPTASPPAPTPTPPAPKEPSSGQSAPDQKKSTSLLRSGAH